MTEEKEKDVVCVCREALMEKLWWVSARSAAALDLAGGSGFLGAAVDVLGEFPRTLLLLQLGQDGGLPLRECRHLF